MKSVSGRKTICSGFKRQKRSQYQSIVALLACGLLLGVTTNLAKVSHGLGLAPLSFLIWSLMGATMILISLSVWRKQLTKIKVRSLEYFVVSGFLTTAGANLIFVNAVPKLGVSFVAMMIALPPLLTYVGALLLGMERFSQWRATGVLLALLGTLLLVTKQWVKPNADLYWIALTVMGPILLAAGNLYRTLRWPPGASAESLAPGMLMAGTSMLIMFACISGTSFKLELERLDQMALIVVQALVFAGQFLLMFVLQKKGGPVMLSLMGGVSAIFGVPIAIVLLNETLAPGFLGSIILVTAGIVCLVFTDHAHQARTCLNTIGGEV